MDKMGTHLYQQFGRDYVTGFPIHHRSDLEKIGSNYGGWIVPTSLLSSDSICYCVGVGEDITFDLGLIERFGCYIYAFDPTPRAIKHVEIRAQEVDEFKFFSLGLWDKDQIVKFYAPANPTHVSHSALNLQRTSDYFEADCRRLGPLMRENGHEELTLLKLDIEGAEYRVLASIVEDNLNIGILCVEYDELNVPLDLGYKRRIAESIQSLVDRGFHIVSVDGKSNYTLIHDRLLGEPCST
jgi:FkbM family methyltransferase